MIKINLCPIDELESQYWYVPDLALAAVVAIVGFLAVQYYLGTIQSDIEAADAKVASFNESSEQLAPDLTRFKNLKTDIDELNGKLEALKAITVSKISKYRPVIVIEHFQNLKPDGVWFDTMKIGTDKSDDFELKGQAFDNILTAELITALRSTESQESDEADLRTQVYFNNLSLVGSSIQPSGPEGFKELGPYPVFTIKGKVMERGVKSFEKPKQEPVISSAEEDQPHSAKF